MEKDSMDKDYAFGYRKLEIYNLAHQLAVQVHAMSLTLPKFEMYEEASQIRRSAKSISSNIVEGYALRKYKNEFIHFLYRAFGSSEETGEHLRFLFETKSLTDENLFNQLSAEYKKLNGMLFNYIQYVEREYETPAFLKQPSPEYGNLNPEP